MELSLPFSIIFIITCTFFHPSSPKSDINTKWHVVEALKQLVEYYKLHFHELNFDALFGLRVVEGHLQEIVKSMAARSLNPADKQMEMTLHTLADEATKAANMAVPHTHDKNPIYFKSMSMLAMKPWALLRHHRKVLSHLQLNHTKVNKKAVMMSEENSERCIAALLDGGGTGKPCSMEDACLDIMFTRGLPAHQLLHQVLYVMLGKMAGCAQALNTWLLTHKPQMYLDKFEIELCSNNYYQMEEQLETGLNPALEDLFYEEQFLCPSLGYMEFLSPERLSFILSMQRPTGCYGNEPPRRPEPRIGRAHGRKPNDAIPQSYLKPQRKLLLENYPSDGCLSHKTAMAAGALVVYLRYLLSAVPASFSHLRLDRESSYTVKYQANLHDYDEDHHKNVLPEPPAAALMARADADVIAGGGRERPGQGPVGDHPRNIPPPPRVPADDRRADANADADSPDENHLLVIPPPREGEGERGGEREPDVGNVYHNAQAFYEARRGQPDGQAAPRVEPPLPPPGRLDLSALLVIVTCLALLVVMCRVVGGRRFLYRYKPLLKI